MAHLVKLECGCDPPLLIISRVQPMNETFTKAVMEDSTIVFLAKMDWVPEVAGRC